MSGVKHYTAASSTNLTTADISFSTEKDECSTYLAIDEKATKILKHSLSISDFCFHKKMYQPTEVIIDVSVKQSTENTSNYVDIERAVFESTFKHAKVSLVEGSFSLGDDFYVHEVLPHYKNQHMHVTLKIYSLDKLLTLRKSSRTFVAKRLGDDILKDETPKYICPWDKDKKKSITYLIDNMRILRYTGKSDGKEYTAEHIFPFLVQYNESFYDMLVRTANRWGEFLFYEDGTLNVGYNANVQPVTLDKNKTQDISFSELNKVQPTVAADGIYDFGADNSSLAGKPIEKSPTFVKAQMGAFGGKADKWIMQQFAAIFKNDKNLPTMMANMLFDNLFNLAKAESSVAKLNADFDDKYFSDYDETKQQYGDYDFAKKGEDAKVKNAYQQFTELNTIYESLKYKTILEKEQTVAENVIYIDYGTNHPQLKLGSIITFLNEKYIVVDIKGGYRPNNNLEFQVIATAQDKTTDGNSEGLFYPAVIPTGHVRYANPQLAIITDAADPTLKNRVRVMFSWQTIDYKDPEKKKDITDETKRLSSPWLNFASNQQGHPVMGRHYEGNPVMIGFENGNVERPYVMGGLADDNSLPYTDMILASPGMHRLTLTDGTGSGMQAFLAGAISPMTKTFMSFAPGTIPSWKWDKDKFFEGGFELTDNYGIYKIAGSTDGRNVSIASDWGDVKINAFTGISISAPNGDVKISGKNVTIEAGNNLKLVSGTNVNYKLWKSKDTKKGTAAQMLLEVTAQVTKKLASTLMDVIDLSLVRSAVEIFFRPVEGSLTMKSNRFLKLEAGENHCEMPQNAFNVKERQKMLDEINKEAIVKGAGIGNGMVEVIKFISPLSRNMIERFYEKYNSCVDELSILKNHIIFLGRCADEPSTAENPAEVCKPIDDLLKELWNQKEDKDWGESKCGFQNVDVDDGAVNKLKDKAVMKILHIDAVQYNAKQYSDSKDNVKKGIIEDRKKLRADIMKSLNKMRKLIYEATHLKPTKEDINKLVGHFNMTVMPKDFKDKIIKAFDPEKLKDVPFYTTVDDSKKTLKSKIDGVLTDNDDLVITLRRLVMINLLEEFGFNDGTRLKLDNDNKPSENGAVPEKPTVATVLNAKAWGAYVRSLNGVPKLEKDKLSTIGGALNNAVSSAWDEQKNKMMFWKGLAERKTWGEGKNGSILFASGEKTYSMKNDRFKAVEPLTSEIKYLGNANITLEDKEKKTLQGFIEKLQLAMYKL